MKSFSLDIPVLKETIAQLEIRIKNIEKIGTDAHHIGNRLVSESWEGQATKSFMEHNQNWKKGYDETVNQLMDFKESLEKVVLAGAEEINEMALELAMPLGGRKGTGARNLISMEQEGIEELKAKCKTLVYEDYEEQQGIMGRIESLSSQLNYPFSIGAEAAKNKKTIEENQEKLQTLKTKLQNYEDRVLLFEQQVVDEMSKYAVIGGHKLDKASFREVLKYQKDDSWKALLSKNVEELSDIEKLVLKAEYERGITHKISQYINKRLGIEGIDFKDFTLEDAATILVRQRKLTLGDILDEIDYILDKCEILDSSMELNLGKNIKYVKKFIPVLVPMEKIEQYLKNEEVQEALQKGFQWTIKAAKIVIENSAIDRNLDLINNGMDGLAALIQGKEYTYEHKGVIYSFGQAFDETEKGEDKFAKGNVSGAYLNFEGEALGFLQTVYLNYENNCSSLENGHGFQEFQRKMDYSAFEKQHFERMGKRPVGERLSEKSAVLGFTYKMIMDIGTDPLTYITGEGIIAGIFGKTGKGASIVGKTDDLLKGTKAVGIEIKGAAGEKLDTVLKQGDNAVSGILDAEKAAKGSSDNIIGGVSKGKGDYKTIAQDKLNNIRNQMPNNDLAKRGNMAMADVKIEGIKSEFSAHSKIDSMSDKGADIAEFSLKKPETERIFETYEPAASKIDGKPFDRFHDTEAKILEDIASQVKEPKVFGTIDLYTELPACQSCTNIIFEFRRKFPNIKLNVYTK